MSALAKKTTTNKQTNKQQKKALTATCQPCKIDV